MVPVPLFFRGVFSGVSSLSLLGCLCLSGGCLWCLSCSCSRLRGLGRVSRGIVRVFVVCGRCLWLFCVWFG